MGVQSHPHEEDVMNRSTLCARITTRRRFRAFERAVGKAKLYGGAGDLLAAYRRA